MSDELIREYNIAFPPKPGTWRAKLPGIREGYEAAPVDGDAEAWSLRIMWHDGGRTIACTHARLTATLDEDDAA